MIERFVSETKHQALMARMSALGLTESCFTETFLLGSGKGGQKVNKTAHCVRLTHLETGTQVVSQDTRNQSLNRYYARQKLCAILETKRPDAPPNKDQVKILKKIKQKKRRKRRSRSEMSPKTDASTLG